VLTAKEALDFIKELANSEQVTIWQDVEFRVISSLLCLQDPTNSFVPHNSKRHMETGWW